MRFSDFVVRNRECSFRVQIENTQGVGSQMSAIHSISSGRDDGASRAIAAAQVSTK
jgi:hypothetical protein